MASQPISLFLSLLLLLTILQQIHSRSTQLESDKPECSGRWIHIRALPPRFNTDLLLNCSSSSFPLYSSSGFCPSLSNHALGPKTHPNSLSWYRTHPHMLEPLFHRRLLEYPCLTPDPSLADAVFLPYYSFLDALPFLYSPHLYNSSALHGLSLHHFLLHHSPSIWSRHSGHDHFLAMARTAWDFSQSPLASDPRLFGTSFLELPEFYNLTALTLESRTFPWQEHAIPHPTSFHPASLSRLEAWLARARRSRRPTLMLFAGGGGGTNSAPNSAPNIRRSIRAECENRTDLCEIVDCSDGACVLDPIRFMRPMLRSSFCLQPPGDTPARRSTFDGILAGCIPVFFEEASARAQYGWHLPRAEYGEFAVSIPKEDVVFNGLRIADVLMGIPRADVRRMRERVLEMAPRVMYRRHGSSAGLRAKKDAFDLAVEGVLRRIKRRLRSLDAGGLGDDDGDE